MEAQGGVDAEDDDAEAEIPLEGAGVHRVALAWWLKCQCPHSPALCWSALAPAALPCLGATSIKAQSCLAQV